MLRELEGQPELASSVRHVLGLIYGARSDNARARSLLGAALEQRRLLSGADAVETLAIQVDLGRLLAWVADGRARPLLDDALTRVERAHGADHPLAASASHAIAELIDGHDEKQRYLERAVATARRQLPSTDSDRIRYITSLAALHARRGRLIDARALFEEAQRNAEALNGGRTAIFIGVLNDFATFDTAAGDFTAAEAKHRRALALAEDLIGPDSFQVANALNNLAVALANQGRLSEAADALHESYPRHFALFGKEHPRTINAMRNLGMGLFLLDEPQQCIEWMSPAVAARERVTGRNDRSATYMKAQLARCLIRAGRRDEGIALLERAVAILGDEGPDVADYAANARLWLGSVLLDTGHSERAEPLVAAAVEHYRRSGRPRHPALAEAECELAQVLAVRARPDEALSLAQGCLPRVARYGQMVPWRKRSTEELLERLRRNGVASAADIR